MTDTPRQNDLHTLTPKGVVSQVIAAARELLKDQPLLAFSFLACALFVVVVLVSIPLSMSAKRYDLVFLAMILAAVGTFGTATALVWRGRPNRDESVDELREPSELILDNQSRSTLDSLIRDAESALSSNQHPLFHQEIFNRVMAFGEDVREWSRGVLVTHGHRQINLLIRVYSEAQSQIFATTNPEYLGVWSGELGSRLLAAQKSSKAQATRVFIFDREKDITPGAMELMHRQSSDYDVDVRVYLNENDPAFDFPADIYQDFIIIDNEILGGTATFRAGIPLTRWHFGRFRAVQLSKAQRVRDSLLKGSVRLRHIEAGRSQRE